MQNDIQLIKKSILSSEGFILLILTATTYTAFIVREMGYTDYFSIPQELISTSHVGLVSTTKALIYGAMAYIGKVNMVWIFAPRGDSWLINFIRRAISIILMVGYCMYPYLTTDVSLWWFTGIVSILLFFWFIFPLITQLRVEGYQNKLERQTQIDSVSHDILGTFLAKFDQSLTITFFCIVSIIIFAYGDGRRSAFFQEEYNLLVGSNNSVLIRIYEDLAVSVAYDPKTQKLNGIVSVAQIPEGKGIEFQKTKIGRLNKATTE